MQDDAKTIGTYKHLVDAFRAPPRRRALPQAERWLVAALAAYGVFAPWAIGLRDLWAHWTALGLAGVALAVALVPREPVPGEAPPWRRLLAFPPFWLGLGLVAYVVVQALNPAWMYEHTLFRWWLREREHIGWLPSGVRSPWDSHPGTNFPQTNAWRQLLLVAGPWLAVCAAWAGLTRRFACRLLLTILAVSAVGIALLAFAQRLDGTDRILWVYPHPYRGGIWGTFTYLNHAGAFFYLTFALATGLALQSYADAALRLRRNHPGPLWILAALTLGLAVVLSGSRGGMLSLGVLALVFGAVVLRALFRPEVSGWARGAAVAGALLLGALCAFSFNTLRTKHVDQRIRSLVQIVAEGPRDQREFSIRAGYDMFLDRPWQGYGLGAFRYHFPKYQQNYPEIARTAENPGAVWRDAHSDILQWFIELGIVGMVFPVAILGWWCWTAARLRAWSSPLAFAVLCGAAMLFAHAGADFLWAGGGLLATWVLLPALALLHLQHEREAERLARASLRE